jgi:carboxymethylenebutenolidase
VDAAEQLEAEMREAGAEVTFHLYEGATHAFFNDLDRPERVGVYDPEAAELSWQRTVSFLRSALARG